MKKVFLIAFFLLLPLIAAAQDGGMALAPARFELEMQPGTETTVVVSLDYHGAADVTKPARIIASLNDWLMTKDGQVTFFPARTQPLSAAGWMIYSPGEAEVMPGSIHQMRVTISVPQNAEPGDHLAALIVEQRPDRLKYQGNTKQMVVRYRLASMFYIKVGKLTREGDLYDLLAKDSPAGIVVTPSLRNKGNSVVRPTASATVFDSEGKAVADLPEAEITPLPGGSEVARAVVFDRTLPPGQYTVKYRVDFQDGRTAVEGVTGVTVYPKTASLAGPVKKP